MLGIWKDFTELEESISMPELTAILEASRDKERREQKFLAALQGVDLDDDSEETDSVRAFEEVKERIMNRIENVPDRPGGLEDVDYVVADENFSWV